MMNLKELKEIYERLIIYDENYIRKNLNRAKYIEEFLEKNKINYEVFEHYVLVPDWIEYYLDIDGKEVKVLPNGLKSGELEEKNIKDSSDLENNYNYPNINFNSQLESKVDISTPVFYNQPALAVSKETIEKLLNSKDFYGKLKVKIRDVKNKNFVIGNLEKAKYGMVVHYDALWYGAIDNTSSLGLTLYLIKNREINLDKVTIFLVGFTEVTYFWPEYWDYSFIRVIEKYEEYFNKFEKIFIVDCVGYKNTQYLYDKEYLEAYGVFGENLEILGTKVEDLMGIYHATNDTIDKLNFNQLEIDKKQLLEKLEK